MLPQEIIRKTRNHEKLTREEIDFFIYFWDVLSYNAFIC